MGKGHVVQCIAALVPKARSRTRWDVLRASSVPRAPTRITQELQSVFRVQSIQATRGSESSPLMHARATPGTRGHLAVRAQLPPQ
jgi:hypothetical protein